MESNFDELVRGDIERFQQKIGLKRGADLQMVMLKAHLLIEEALQAFIDRSVRNASLLTKARFTFAQRLVLAEALHPDPNCFGYGWVWESVRDLNALRNQMAHHLEPKDFSTRIAEWADSIEVNLLLLVKRGEGTEYEMARFGHDVSVLNVCLARLLHSYHFASSV